MKSSTYILIAALFPFTACAAAPDEDPGYVEAESVETESTELNLQDIDVRDILAQCSELSESCCGLPGDRGNAYGVGKFCLTDKQCRHNKKATVCSSAENEGGDHKSFFCTMGCDPAGAENQCGKGATCECEENGACGCTPISCTENLPAHCEEI
jgi:hypothetical protein